jgi:pimeloyl-ACP methyl ester carboxylesterase
MTSPSRLCAPGAPRQRSYDDRTGRTSSEKPFTLRDAEAIRTPTLLVGGVKTPGSLPIVLFALAAHIPDAQVAIIPNALHFMFGRTR